ncbi:MAG: hypothetical protein ABFD66_03650 [Smithella sp.]
MTNENNIDHTALYLRWKYRGTKCRVENGWLCDLLHRRIVPTGGNIRGTDSQREAIRREREKLRVAHEAEKRREWAEELVREIFDHKSFKRLIRSLRTHGLRPRAEGEKPRRDRGLNPGGVQSTRREPKGREDKGKGRTLVARNRV